MSERRQPPEEMKMAKTKNGDGADTNGSMVLVTTARAGEILGLTPRALEERRRRGGSPPYVRLSPTCVRYRLSDLERWVQERTFSSTAEERPADK